MPSGDGKEMTTLGTFHKNSIKVKVANRAKDFMEDKQESELEVNQPSTNRSGR